MHGMWLRRMIIDNETIGRRSPRANHVPVWLIVVWSFPVFGEKKNWLVVVSPEG